MTAKHKIKAEIEKLTATKEDDSLSNMYNKGMISGLYYALDKIKAEEKYDNWIQSVFDRLNNKRRM